MQDRMIMNRVLRLVRSYHDMNLSEASKHIGLSKSYISQLEHGHKKASLVVLEKYAAAFDISVSTLVLFSEHAETKGLAEKVRGFTTDKAVKMLEWIEMISVDKERDHAK